MSPSEQIIDLKARALKNGLRIKRLFLSAQEYYNFINDPNIKRLVWALTHILVKVRNYKRSIQFDGIEIINKDYQA